jgi:hypothetical protein
MVIFILVSQDYNWPLGVDLSQAYEFFWLKSYGLYIESVIGAW